MARHKHKKFRNHAADFALICKLARGGYRDALRRLLHRHASVALCVNLITPVMQLAMEGNDQAVWMLIHEFGASLHHAVEGYARVGRHDQVEQFIKLGADISAAAFGYSFVGNHVKAGELLQRGADVETVARGYALAGLSPTKKIADLMLALENDDADTREQMLEGYAYAGHKDLVEKILAEGFHTDVAVQGYARAGRVAMVEDLLARGADIHSAVYGYARGGFVLRVENLLTRGARQNMAMEGYAASGMIDQVRDLHLRDTPILYAMRSAARVGWLPLVEYIYKQTGDLINATYGFHDAGYFDNETILLRLLSHLHNTSFRKSIANAAKEYLKNLNTHALLDKAWRIHKIMEDYHLHYDQAVVLQKPGLRVWLLQGVHAEPKLPPDMYFEIAAQLGETSQAEIKKILKAVVGNTYEGAKIRIHNKHHPGFFRRLFHCHYDKKTADKRERDDVRELDKRYILPKRL